SSIGSGRSSISSIANDSQDDDGEGVPDVLEGKSTKDSSFDLMTLILLVLCAVAVVLFLGRMKKGMNQ
ncbi:MAG: hypothetical protein P8Q94_03265, partial [Candidatus Poseidoniaceae archaeon]|nr:hypothetical protein [Candidatus Poseidoniaceae archaeon]